MDDITTKGAPPRTPQGQKLSPDASEGIRPWFVGNRSNSRLHKICRAAHGEVWAKRVQQQFDLNSFKDGNRPTNWNELGEVINKHGGGLTRYAHAFGALKHHRKAQVPDVMVRYAAAWALGTEDSELSPDGGQWVAQASRFLMLIYAPNFFQHVQSDDIRAYAQYIYQAEPNSVGFLDYQVCESIWRQEKGFKSVEELMTAVHQVAGIIGRVLRSEFQGESE